MLNLTALTTSDSGSKKTARFLLQVQFKNIYSGPVMRSASRFSPGFLWQGLPLILGSALQQAGLEDIDDPVPGRFDTLSSVDSNPTSSTQ